MGTYAQSLLGCGASRGHDHELQALPAVPAVRGPFLRHCPCQLPLPALTLAVLSAAAASLGRREMPTGLGKSPPHPLCSCTASPCPVCESGTRTQGAPCRPQQAPGVEYRPSSPAGPSSQHPHPSTAGSLCAAWRGRARHGLFTWAPHGAGVCGFCWVERSQNSCCSSLGMSLLSGTELTRHPGARPSHIGV